MRTKIWISLVAVGVACAAFFIARSFYREARANDVARRSIVGQRLRLEVQLREWTAQARQAERQRTRLRAGRESSAVVPSSEPASTARPPIPLQSERLRKDPQLQLHYLNMRRAELAVSYGPLFRTLGLSREQIERLLDASVAFDAAELDLRAIRENEKGVAGTGTAVAALRKKMQAELEAAQRAVLGTDGARQLADYERTRPARDVVGRFAGGAAVAGAPLSAAQAEQLTQALAAACGDFQAAGKVDAARIDWSAADRAAAAILSPEQLTLFTQTDLTLRWTTASVNAMRQALTQSMPRK